MRKENQWQFRLKTPMQLLLEVKIPHCLSGGWIYPVLIHYGAAIVSILIFLAYYTWRMDSSSLIENPLIIQQKLLDSTLQQLMLTSVTAGLICFGLYRKDQTRRKEGSLGRGIDFVWSPPVVWFSVIVLAVAGSQLLNDLIIIFHLNDIFPSYQEMTSVSMSGRSDVGSVSGSGYFCACYRRTGISWSGLSEDEG